MREAEMKCSSNSEHDRVEAIVLAVIPEYSQTIARGANGRQYAITTRATGHPWNALREVQRVRCLVARAMGRVLSVEVLE